MRSLFTAVSGLKNHQTRMDVIGNNIANVNTTGFKSGRVTFADTLSQTLSGSSSPNGTTGGVNAKQIGLGMSVASVDTNFTHGSASSTGNNTDLAIDTDNGLFIVKNGNETYYTRNGNFTLDSNGNLTMNGNGYYVQGWNGVDGNVNASGDTQNLKIDMNSTMQPKATSTVTSSGNLSADDTAETVKGIKLTLADGTTISVPANDTTTPYSVGSTVDKNKVVSIKATLADGSTGVTLPPGSYAAGTLYPSGGTISGIKLTLDDNSVVNVPEDDLSSYQIGETYPDGSTKKIKGIEITTKNDSGEETTKNIPSSDTVDTFKIGQPYTTQITELYPTTLSGNTATTADTDPTHTYEIGSGGTSDYPFGTPDNVVINSMTLTLSDGTNTTASSGVYGVDYNLGGAAYPSYTTTATIYDSLGAAHSIPVSFQRTDSSSDTWLASVAPGTYDNITIPSGVTQTMTFDGSTGKLTSGGAMDVTLAIPYPNGATQNQQVSLDFNALTQYSGENNASATGDGYTAGFYKDMSIGQDGVITVTYTNGEKQTAGQIAIATFNNTSGLEKSGGSLYSQSNNSGTARVGTFASQSVTVTPGALEMSNVDIANEFSDMIVTQRGFQANSKIITTSDEMLQTLINMKQS